MMRRYINAPLVKRTRWIARILLYSGFGMLAGAFVISLRRPDLLTQVLLVASAGFLASQLGTSLNNRWGRSPRMDEIFDYALKGLDDRYAIFHYLLGTQHALLTPDGAFALFPLFEEGEIRYKDGAWWADQPRRGLLRRGGTKQIRTVQNTEERERKRLAETLAKKGIDVEAVNLQALPVFLHDRAFVKSDDSSPPATHLKKLKSYLRRHPKQKGFDERAITSLAEKMGQEA
jgi:hypothetical protein